MVMSPEHPFIEALTVGTEYEAAVKEYQEKVAAAVSEGIRTYLNAQ